jgi:3-dehydroquinate synthase
MSVSFKIEASTGDYSVDVQAGLFQQVLGEKPSDIVIADEWFSPVLAKAGVLSIAIPAEETIKSLDAIPELIVKLRQMGANRQTRLVAIGGGIVQDVAAFIASVYMRGLEWIYVPTTLLAMADSCIGGKSSINVGPYKNLVGTFHPPASVVIDPALALTLTDEQRVSGLVEAAKICYCRGPEAFEEYLAQGPAASMEVEQLERIVVASLLSKKWFIEIDEFDKGERLLLNFGHTFGHAIEGASHFRIAHGLGVAIGILCAIELGKLMGRSYSSVARLQTLDAHLRDLLGGIASLSGELKALSIDDILDRFQADKKHRTECYSVILVAESGAVELVKLPKDPPTRRAIETAITEALRELC